MLSYYRKPVSFSFLSTNLPILKSVEATATLYQKDQERFHLLLNDPLGCPPDLAMAPACPKTPTQKQISNSQNPKRLLWLEFSAHRAILTTQGDGDIGYRHYWQTGVTGISRYWLHRYRGDSGSFRLQNYARGITLTGQKFPESLRIDYELRTPQMMLGHFVIHLEIHH
ncbi:MAG: hypothetical protein AAGG02_06625 [Cyanobacteria bacterium P01_H01_bin.15]